MDRLSGTGKRPLADDTSERPAKKPRIDQEAVDMLMEFEHTASTRLGAEYSHAIDQIRVLLQSDPTRLDLSGFPAATVSAIVPMMPEAWLAQLTHLILPDHLHALPDRCNRMKSLEYLTLQGFAGRRLDLLKFPKLRQVSGAVSAMTEEIHLHAHVDVALTTQRLTKLRCHRLLENGQVRTHALPGQAYYKILPGRSTPDTSSMNGIVTFSGTNIPIVCRHIAEYVRPHLELKDIAATPANGYLGISVPADLTQKISLDSNVRFAADVWFSRAYHGVSDSHFGPWIKEQFAAMMHAARSGQPPSDGAVSKSFYALSSSHAMVLVLRYKPDKDEQFVEVFMDPNLTLTHKRNTQSHLGPIATGDRSWRISDLLDPQTLPQYFLTGSTPALMFVESGRRAEGQVPDVNLNFVDRGFENFYGPLLHGGVTEAVEGVRAKLKDIYAQGDAMASSIFTALQAPHWQLSVFGLEAAVTLGYANTVKAHMRAIEDFLVWYATLDPHNQTHRLPEDFCGQLICPSKSLAEIYKGTVADRRPALHVLLDSIGDLYEKDLIPSETCLALLAKPFGGETLMEKALLAHDEESVRRTGRLLSRLLNNDAIHTEQCGWILDSTFDNPAADRLSWTVLRQCPDTMVENYGDLLVTLGQAALNSSEIMAARLLGVPEMAEWNVNQQLLTPLLFPAGDAGEQITRLRLDGEVKLADRLEELARRTRISSPLESEGAPSGTPFE